MSGLDGVDGVNVRHWWEPKPTPPQPQTHGTDAQPTVLLVDKNGKPLVVRQPRPVGFRRP